MARRGASWQANPKTPLDMQIMMAKWVPGPGQYYQMSDPSAAVRGGKINVSNSKSDIEWAIYRAKTLPGPGQYDIDKAAKAQAKNVRPPRSKLQISPRAACDTHRIQITCPHLRHSSVGQAIGLTQKREQVPKFSFQGRPGPATMPAPFHSL